MEVITSVKGLIFFSNFYSSGYRFFILLTSSSVFLWMPAIFFSVCFGLLGKYIHKVPKTKPWMLLLCVPPFMSTKHSGGISEHCQASAWASKDLELKLLQLTATLPRQANTDQANSSDTHSSKQWERCLPGTTTKVSVRIKEDTKHKVPLNNLKQMKTNLLILFLSQKS